MTTGGNDIRDALVAYQTGGPAAAQVILQNAIASLANNIQVCAQRSIGRAFPGPRDVSRVRAPMLFVHAKDDPVIPLRMTEELYATKPEPRLVWLFESGGHGLPVAPADLTALGRKIDELLAMTR